MAGPTGIDEYEKMSIGFMQIGDLSQTTLVIIAIVLLQNLALYVHAYMYTCVCIYLAFHLSIYPSFFLSIFFLSILLSFYLS